MTLINYAPLREFQKMQNQFDRLLAYPWQQEQLQEDSKTGIWQPPVDIYESADSIVIKTDIPEVDQKELEVKLHENTLTIRGERKRNTDIEANAHRVERFYGPFQRIFSLPGTLDQEKISAQYKNGVLTITIPKKEETKPKTIRVELK